MDLGKLTKKAKRVALRQVRGIVNNVPLEPCKPKVSVIILVHNAAEHIDETLHSVSDQKFLPLEAIVVNYGSTDLTQAVAEEYVKKDFRFRIITHQSSDSATARNIGVKHARGKYVYFLDAGDWATPDTVSELYKSCESNGADVAAQMYYRTSVRPETNAPEYIQQLFYDPKTGVTLHEIPSIFMYSIAGGKLINRKFLSDSNTLFRAGAVYNEQRYTAELYRKARKINTVGIETYFWFRARIVGKMPSASELKMQDLEEYVALAFETLDMIKKHGYKELYCTRLLQYIFVDFRMQIRNSSFATREYYVKMQNTYTKLLELWRTETNEELPAQALFVEQIYKTNSQEMLRKFCSTLSFRDNWLFTDNIGGKPTINLEKTFLEPDKINAGETLYSIIDKAKVYKLHEMQANLTVKVYAARRNADEITYEGCAYFTGVDPEKFDYNISATASSPHNPHLQIPLKLERIWSPEALKEVSMRTFNTAAAGFRITIDAKVLEQFKGDFMCNFTISAASFTAQCIKKLETAKFAGFKRELGEKISDIQIEKVDLADDALIFHLKRENDTSKSAEIEVSLANDMQIVPKQVKAKMEAGESELTIKLPLYAAYPGYPEKLIASRAEYGISCSQVIDGEKYRIVPSQNLADSLSHCEYYEKLNMKLVIAEDWRLTLALRTTHSAEDMGSYNIVRNRYDYYLSPKKVVPKSVLFDVFSGTTVSSSPLAIHNEMIKREGADEYTYNWFVRDYSKILPEKATPVIYESKEYYYALSSSSVYFDTVMQRPWFQKSPGQQICYLAHGYPFKNSGLNFHRTLPNGDLLVENLVKRIKQWDYFLLPAPYGSKLYRDLYDYDGKILEVGYPRNDIFFHADEVSEVRERIRKAYGILDGKKAVLYVPTWRDYKRVEVFKAEKYAALDLHKFAEDLGDEYVILNREHHNTVAKKQNEKEKSAARIIDVSTHPNINDLIIASDMMIGDYSSARFDYSLTKKPIINYVPDIDRYQDGRAFLMPFEDASVGPIIKEQDDLVHSVLTSDQWSSTPEYRAEQDAFFNKYTPLEDGFAAKRVVDALFPEIGERR